MNEWSPPIPTTLTNGLEHIPHTKKPGSTAVKATMATADGNGAILLDWKLFIGGIVALLATGLALGIVFAQHLPFMTTDEIKPITDNLSNQIAQQGLALTQLRQQVTDDENKWYSLSEKLDDLRTDTKAGQAQIIQRLDDETRDRETQEQQQPRRGR